MRQPKDMIFGLVAIGFGLFVLLNCPALTTAQALDDAQGEGEVSIPVPYSPGIDTVTGPALSLGVPAGSPIHGTNVRAAGGPNTSTQSEISMTSSGPSIVITFNDFTGNGSGFVTSTDGGITFTPKASFPSPTGSAPCCDPGIVADLLGRFYFVQIFFDDGANTPNPGNCTNSLHVSTDGGQTFSSIIGSPFSYAPGTTDFPDQPHVGIDRINLVGGQPQLYVFARHFTSGINCPATGSGGTVQGEVVCSTNGGTAWTAPIVLAPFTDTAHWATGSDGSVYIVGNGLSGTILLRRSTNDCNAGLAFGAPATVASGLTYGSTGIDREFPQPYVAVDKVNPDIAYVAWSSDRLANDGDRDIFLARCIFSGTAGSCDAPVRINDNPIGDGTSQYFPMLCVDPNNTINLSWDDQRAGARSTAIYHAEVTPTGASLSVGPSFLTSEVNFTPVDFGGAPDYGDYNENNDACDGQHFYVAWSSQVSPSGITPASNDVDVFFAVVNNLADIRVQGPLDFGDVCRGNSQVRQLDIFNVGDATLLVNNVSRVSGSTDITVDPNPTLPLTISPDAHVNFSIRCTPTTPGFKSATIRVESTDPDQPQIDLTATCNVVEPAIDTIIANSGNFGDVCVGSFKDLNLTIVNNGGCVLSVNNISSSSPEFKIPSVTVPFPIHAGDSIQVPIRFQPTTPGPKTAAITVSSNAPTSPSIVSVSGNAPTGSIRVTGSTDFGDVCGGTSAEKTISVCDVGACNLTVTSAAFSPSCSDFTLVNNPFPAAVSPDSCLGLTIRFTPTSPGPKTCTLVITSDDPAMPVITETVTADTPANAIDVSPDQGFPPAVIQSVGACQSSMPFPISNTGTCNLKITNIAIGGTNGSDFSLSGLPSFPIILEPGHVAGEGDLEALFKPAALDRDRTGTLTVTYESDPITHATTSVTRNLCGEGVRTGARVLVRAGGVPLAMVERIHLQRMSGNRNKNILDTADVAKDLPLQTVTPAAPCSAFQFHREYGTVSNPIQLAPGSYVVTVSAIVNGKKENKTVGFDVDTCGFNPTIMVDF